MKMQLKELYEELLAIADKIGIKVRKEKGNFSGGNCVINNKNFIVINNSVPLEMKTSTLAKCLRQYPIDNVFIKPVVREYIEQEIQLRFDSKDEYELIVDEEE